MAFTKRDKAPTIALPALGEEGEACASCGSPLATDQRYCLNCGTRRAGPRLDYEERLVTNGGVAAGGAPATAAPAPVSREWTPVAIIGTIAVLGIMLLLGVLIGKDNTKTTQVTAGPATTTPTTASTTTPTTPTATTASSTPKATAPGGGNVVKGGSATTSGVAAASGGQKTGAAALKNNSAVATQGAPAKQTPTGPAGGGSAATCIGC